MLKYRTVALFKIKELIFSILVLIDLVDKKVTALYLVKYLAVY